MISFRKSSWQHSKKISIILFIFLFVLFSRNAFAQKEIDILPSPQLSPATTSVPEVNYELPYPGILPGSPLYTVKTIRDRIIEFLTTDSLKKSEFYLLQADKRMAEALMFFQKNDDTRAYIALSKSQNYLEKSFSDAKKTKELGNETGGIIERIKNSSAKQKQEIEILMLKSKERGGSLKPSYQKAESIRKNAESLGL